MLGGCGRVFIDGGSNMGTNGSSDHCSDGGTETPGNDALASVVLHIQERGGDEAPAMPDDFPGHQGAVYRPNDLSDHMPRKSKPGATLTYNGNGTSTDVIVASAKAYLDALNRMIDAQDKRQRA